MCFLYEISYLISSAIGPAISLRHYQWVIGDSTIDYNTSCYREYSLRSQRFEPIRCDFRLIGTILEEINM